MIDPPNDADNVFTQAIAHHSMVNPFQEEGEALRSQPPGQLLSHEKIRLARIDSFTGLFKMAQPPYTAAAKSGNWAKAAQIAHHVRAAAKKVVAPLLLLFFLSAQGRSQTLPAQAQDPVIAEDLEYLDQQIRAVAASLAVTVSSITAINTTAVVYGSTVVYPSGSIGSSAAVGPCVSHSSATWTQTGAHHTHFSVGGAFLPGGSANFCFMLLLDSGFFPEGSVTKCQGALGGSNNGPIGIDFTSRDTLAAGSHTVCLTGTNNGATATIPTNSPYTGVVTISVQELSQ